MKIRRRRYCSSLFPFALWAILVSVGSLTGVSLGSPAEPETVELSEPIRITADQLIADSKTDTAQFSGNVHAVQGDTEITADKLTIYYNSENTDPSGKETDAINRIKAMGNVRISFDNRLAVSERAVYIMSERKLILEGPGSKMISGRDEIVGSKITFFRDNGRVAMEGDEKNPVKAILHSTQRGLN